MMHIYAPYVDMICAMLATYVWYMHSQLMYTETEAPLVHVQPLSAINHIIQYNIYIYIYIYIYKIHLSWNHNTEVLEII